ncbi:unnamed protein product [Enterobius vermicularis]|uniref:Phlebovirus glycoprotein G2 fusion domain-containing protein n=1 Tax=Enterobius vermicularis TaxID=51028 RepID=A0A0N4VC78_ENTVE|nr:unnamed protein product [Enterobius vermicularis]
MYDNGVLGEKLNLTELFTALTCFDGADCVETLSCSQCNGVACMRIKSFNIESNHEVAFTSNVDNKITLTPNYI